MLAALLAFSAWAASAPPDPVHPADEPAQPTRIGVVDDSEREVIRCIVARDARGLVSLFADPMRAALPESKAGPFIEGLLKAKGPLRAVERAPGSTGDRSAEYIVRAERGEWRMKLTVDADGKVLGFQFGEPPAPEPPLARSTLALELPFKGPWLVSWGGATLDKNQHVPHRSQRRAADLLVVDQAGKTHKDKGARLEDYYAYGKDVLAAADGVVVTVIDGVPDNQPGSMNPYFALGNTVIIRHRDDVFSMVGHLIPGSVRVKVGDTVKAGQELGRCGNSGNSTEPHIHFQLQDSALFESSWGVEPRFARVKLTRGNKASTASDYTFEKGDVIEPIR